MYRSYTEFIESKAIQYAPIGFSVSPKKTNGVLFPFQQHIVSRALKLGRSAVFAQTGLGKSGMEWAWCSHVAKKEKKPVLLVTPLAVSKQMAKECSKFGIELTIISSQEDVVPGINVTNYEKLHKFDPNTFGGICLDESSILKNFSGRISNQIIEFSQNIRYRLSATATPAPNDYEEFGMQAEFLGVMSRVEMLATFFRHDGGNTSDWKLMHYAEDRFWNWLASWAIVCRVPSDVGNFDDSPYNLPPIEEFWHPVEHDLEPEEGQLIKVMSGMKDRRSARKQSLQLRCEKAIEIVNNSDEPWLVWCEQNDEGNYLTSKINGAVQVSGSDTDEAKESRLLGFASGEFRVLVTKPKIAGWGMNYQHCRNILFVGVDDSWERRYQAVKRCHRFGQTKQVNVHTIHSSAEYPVLQNLARKQIQADRMGSRMLEVIRGKEGTVQDKTYKPTIQQEIPQWLK